MTLSGESSRCDLIHHYSQSQLPKTYVIDTHQDTDLSFQAGGDLGVKVVVLHDDLDCVLHASLSVCASVHCGKVARSELRSAFVLAVKSLPWF